MEAAQAVLENLKVSPGPHISRHYCTRRVMLDVIIALVPAMIAAWFYFQMQALIVLASCVISCCITEWLCTKVLKRPCTLGDLSAVVTGLLLGFSVPPHLPWWACIIGSVFAIGIGKMVFGGLGSNIFNPAMVGRCFLTACFGMLMATWTTPSTIDKKMPMMSPDGIIARTQATPLAWAKKAIRSAAENDPAKIIELDESNLGSLKDLFIGSRGGCLGETSALALLIGAAWLFYRKTINWHIPMAVLVSSFLFSLVFWLINRNVYASPIVHLLSGGMMLGAFFIATDPVTAPLTGKGMLIFGAGVGFFTMLIRIIGQYPEGIMYAVLLMNSITPLIDRAIKLIPAGGKPNA